MSSRSRKLLFRFCIFLFFIIGSLLVAYSLGIKLDLMNLTFTETGGIYVKSRPADADIYLDGKRINNTSGFFQTGTIVDNLKEDRYHLTLQKNGYYDWQKDVEVSPSLVNVFDNIIMVPQKEPTKIAEPADKAELLGGILLTEKGGNIYAGEIKIPGTDIVETAQNDSVITYDDDAKAYYLISLTNPDLYLNINNIFNKLKENKLGLPGAVPMLKVAFHPFNRDRIIVRTRGALYNIDITRATIEKVADGATEFETQGNNLFFYTSAGLYRYNLIFRTTAELTSLKAEKTIKDFSGTSSGGVIVLYEDGELSLISGNGTKRIADKAKIFTASDNGELIAFGDNDQSLHIYNTDKLKYTDIRNGVIGNLNKIVWYKDNSHLLLQNDASLYFSESGETLPINCFKIADDVKDFSYDKDQNTIYINSGSGVLEYEI